MDKLNLKPPCPLLSSWEDHAAHQAICDLGQLTKWVKDSINAVTRYDEQALDVSLEGVIQYCYLDARGHTEVMLYHLTTFCLILAAEATQVFQHEVFPPTPGLWDMADEEGLLRWKQRLMEKLLEESLLTSRGKQMTLVRSYINQNFQFSYFSARKAAEAFGLSPSTLSDRFYAQFGIQISEYIRNRRMELAKSMMHSSGKSLEAIAFDAGYGSYVSMHRAFCTTEGMAPGAFRKLVQQNANTIALRRK